MKKNINIKTLAKGMRVEDKAKLIFADRIKRGETRGAEGLLTPDEEKALIDDAQDLHQIKELNRLNRLFNIAGFMMIDIQTAYLHFKLAEDKLLTILTGMILVGEASDAMSQAIYDLSTDGFSKEQLEDKKYQDEVDKKAEKYNQKYRRDGLTKSYDYFEPPLREGYFSTKTGTLSQPNPLMQRIFMMVITEVKRFRRQVYSLQYVETKAGITLVSDKDRQTIQSFTEEIDNFVGLDSYLGLIQMYADFADRGMLRKDNLSEPGFLEAVKDMKKATKLGKKAKEEAEADIEEAMQKHNY